MSEHEDMMTGIRNIAGVFTGRTGIPVAVSGDAEWPPVVKLVMTPDQFVHVADPHLSDLLTEHEHQAMEMTAELVSHICGKVVADGVTSDADIDELIIHIHAIQHMIMAQAAARAYPNLYRPLGGSVRRT